MKLGPVLLINLVTVALALVVYDQLRSEATPSRERASTSRSSVADTAALERRLDVLEARLAASPRPEDTEPGVLERLAALEASVRGRDATTDGPPAMARPTKGESPTPMASPDEPSADEVQRFRRLQEAVRRENSIKKNWERVDRALGGLSINLTKSQRRKIHEAYAAFEPQVNVIWGAIKTSARETMAAGGEVDGAALRVQGATQIQQEFAATLNGILDHQADAQAVAAALHPAPGMGGKR